MDLKKWLLGGVVAFVVMYILSYIWYMPLMGGFYGDAFADVARPNVDFLWITLGYLFYGLAMAFVYPIGYQGGPGMKEGMRFGLIAGVLIWLAPQFIYLGSFELTFKGTLVDTIYHIVEAMIGGTVIGALYGSPEAEAEPEPAAAPVTPPPAEPSTPAGPTGPENLSEPE